VVTVEIGELSNLPEDNTNTLTIKKVKNPGIIGVTGNFRIESRYKVNLLDSGDTFGQLGFVDYWTSLTASVSCSEYCATG